MITPDNYEPACLNCGNRDVLAVPQPDGRELPPQPGDPVCCLTCGEVATVNAEGRMCSFTDQQITAVCAKFGLDPAKVRRKSQLKRP